MVRDVLRPLTPSADIRGMPASYFPAHIATSSDIGLYIRHSSMLSKWRIRRDNPARFDVDTVKGFAKLKKQKHHAAVAWGDLPALYRQLPDDAAGNALRFLILTPPSAILVLTMARGKQVEGENGTSAWVYTGRERRQARPASRAAH